MVGLSKVTSKALAEDSSETGNSSVMVGDSKPSSKDGLSSSHLHSKKRMGSPLIPERYVMVFLCALCTCINYADRVNMSVAIISMTETYNFDIKQQSIVLSSFFLGYIPMQIGGAVLCRRFGAKVVLTQGALFWSIFTILTPFAADFSLSLLLFCRVLMGLAEGVAFPSVYHFLSSWIPSHERGRAVALFLTGAHVGTVAALVVSPYIIRILDWRYIFYIFGSIGFAWIAAWQLIAYDRDDRENLDESTAKHQSTLESDTENVPLTITEESTTSKTKLTQTNSKSKDEPTPNSSTIIGAPGLSSNSHRRIFTRSEWRIIRTILSDRRTLCVCFSQMTFSMIHYVILSWLPTYFKEVFGTDVGSLSFTCIPYACMAIAANAGGFISDALIRSGKDITRVRKVVTVISSVGAALLLIVFGKMQTVSHSIAAASCSMAFMSMHSGGFESAYLDLASPKSTGIFKAVANTLASGSGFVAVPLSTYVLHLLGGSWRAMFASLSILHVLFMVVFVTTYSAERVLIDEAL